MAAKRILKVRHQEKLNSEVEILFAKMRLAMR